jgi:bla regulator protein blaR1
LSHVTQRHSIDIIMIELFWIFFWFNPLLFIYQRMIRVNHEFLADEAVIKKGADAKRYQYLLLTPQPAMTGIFPASSFNYNITKKRLIMISRSTSPLKALARQMAVIIPASGLFLLCCVETVAQDTIPGVSTTSKTSQVSSTSEGVSDELMSEYKAIAGKIMKDNKQGSMGEVTEADRSRLETIFTGMSKEQQGRQTIRFIPTPPPLTKSVPTTKQWESMKTAKDYVLRINGWRASVRDLEKYKATDFSRVEVVGIFQNAKGNRKHYYHVQLMTKEYYENYLKARLAEIKKHPLTMVMASEKKVSK